MAETIQSARDPSANRELVTALQASEARVLSLETEVEHWKSQAAGEYLKNRDLTSSDALRLGLMAPAPASVGQLP